MKIQVTTEVQLITETCVSCGTVFAVESSLHHTIKQGKQHFYCPNGHSMTYADYVDPRVRELEAALKNERDNAQWWKGEAEQKARQLSSTRGQLTKTRRRIANGVCPCCNRQFTNMTEHMKTKHPEYVKEHQNDDRQDVS